MPAIVILAVMLIPQFVAGIYAKSIDKSFWFFISFLTPIISLIVLLFFNKSKGEQKGYELADHVKKNR